LHGRGGGEMSKRNERELKRERKEEAWLRGERKVFG
jgi:hypothetical protein